MVDEQYLFHLFKIILQNFRFVLSPTGGQMYKSGGFLFQQNDVNQVKEKKKNWLFENEMNGFFLVGRGFFSKRR